MISLASYKFKKGDKVVVNDGGNAVVYEIISTFATDKRLESGEACYDARQVTNGTVRTFYQDEILRLATPVDSSAELFKSEK